MHLDQAVDRLFLGSIHQSFAFADHLGGVLNSAILSSLPKTFVKLVNRSIKLVIRPRKAMLSERYSDRARIGHRVRGKQPNARVVVDSDGERMG